MGAFGGEEFAILLPHIDRDGATTSDIETLLAQADAAMYRAKNEGREAKCRVISGDRQNPQVAFL